MQKMFLFFYLNWKKKKRVSENFIFTKQLLKHLMRFILFVNLFLIKNIYILSIFDILFIFD